jgi:3',5'-nucleoside bisphosphate phosphatase
MTDLHTHSSASDGTLSPIELVQYAAKKGVSIFALTDHDTVAGLDQAIKCASEYDITLIPGIEMEITCPTGEFHMLGLGIKDWTSGLLPVLARLKIYRKERNKKILHKIQNHGIPVLYRDVEVLAGGEIVGRMHFAQLLIQHKLVKSIREAFTRYLGNGLPFYEERQTLAADEAIDAIHKAGGKAVIAHPYSLHISWTNLENKLYELKQLGLDGIEAFHSNIPPGKSERYRKLAERIGLVLSAGSDFHGASRPDRQIGRIWHGEKIQDSFAEPFL